MAAAQEALRDYPERPRPYGLVLMAAGLAAVVAGLFLPGPLLPFGGLVYLAGMVWNSVERRRWKLGFYEAFAASNEELTEELRARYPEAARAADAASAEEREGAGS